MPETRKQTGQQTRGRCCCYFSWPSRRRRCWSLMLSPFHFQFCFVCSHRPLQPHRYHWPSSLLPHKRCFAAAAPLAIGGWLGRQLRHAPVSGQQPQADRSRRQIGIRKKVILRYHALITFFVTRTQIDTPTHDQDGVSMESPKNHRNDPPSPPTHLADLTHHFNLLRFHNTWFHLEVVVVEEDPCGFQQCAFALSCLVRFAVRLQALLASCRRRRRGSRR